MKHRLVLGKEGESDWRLAWVKMLADKLVVRTLVDRPVGRMLVAHMLVVELRMLVDRLVVGPLTVRHILEWLVAALLNLLVAF